LRRIEIGHHDQTGGGVFADERRHHLGADPSGLAEPGEFLMAIAPSQYSTMAASFNVIQSDTTR
jgi:hypothetical protein